jgi:hypothetical protein
VLIPLGILAAAGGEAEPAYELIETYILGSATSEISFTSLGTYSSEYKHLQLRAVAKSTNVDNLAVNVNLQFNGDGGNNYDWHLLRGNGSTVSSSASSGVSVIDIGDITAAGGGGGVGGLLVNQFGVMVVDFLDCYSTSKFTTTRSLSGTTAGPRVRLGSGLWRNTAAITSFNLTNPGNFVAGSRFSLYGIKG